MFLSRGYKDKIMEHFFTLDSLLSSHTTRDAHKYGTDWQGVDFVG
jgi:hypothetical protein